MIYPFGVRQCEMCGYQNKKWTFGRRYCNGTAQRIRTEDGMEEWHQCKTPELQGDHLHCTCERCGFEFVTYTKPKKEFK